MAGWIGGGAMLWRSRLLAARRPQSVVKQGLHLGVRCAAHEQRPSLESIQFGLKKPFAVVAYDPEPVIDQLQSCLGFVAEQQDRAQEYELRREAELITRTLIFI